MQRLTVGLLVLVLLALVAIAVQLDGMSARLDARDRDSMSMMEARIIVLEKYIERIKAKEELRAETDKEEK